MRQLTRSLPLALLIVSRCTANADDWPQFRGPQRDGVSRETNLLKSWPEGGPKLLWLSTNLGNGYSWTAIVGEKIYITGQSTHAQWLFCLDTKDGKELWATRLGDPYTNDFGDGPRGTPTVRDGLVFALGANGELLCAETATGQERWRTNLTALGGTVPGWGYSESPIVSGDQVYMVAAGGTGCKAVKLTGPTLAEAVYANKVMKNLPGGVVLFDGHLYGYSDSIGWVCQNWLTGGEVWSSKALERRSPDSERGRDGSHIADVSRHRAAASVIPANSVWFTEVPL